MGQIEEEGSVRETEKPNISGWAAKRRLRIVDLPVPEGPDITIGRCSCVAVIRHVREKVSVECAEGGVTSGSHCCKGRTGPSRRDRQGFDELFGVLP